MPLRAPAEVKLRALDVRVRLPVALPIVVALPPVLARVVVLVLERVVKAPVEAVLAPIAVELIPVPVVLKLDEVTVRALEPVLILDALRPLKAKAPLVPVRLTAPVVTVSPLEAVRVWLTVKAPALVVVIPLLPRVIAVALLVPIDRVVPPDRTSRLGDCKAVPKIPVPDMFSLPV
jgi:hypothetical protein